MKRVFHCGLPNGIHGDPLLVVRLRWERRVLLFDLGDVSPLAAADLLKVSHAFVTHTHLDHFVGFDRLVRTRIGDSRPLTVVGPEGILENVRGKLRGYTWNLVAAYPFALDVHEVAAGTVRRFAFPREEGFEPTLTGEDPFEGVLLREPSLEVRATAIDHGIRCLAYAVREPRRLNIRKERLDEDGLPTGPWLAALKRAVLAGEDDGATLEVPSSAGSPETRSIGELRERYLLEGRGEKIGYVTDAAGHDENMSRLVELVRDADRLFCEAMFSRADADRAREYRHLTTRDAGRLAREARVGTLVPFHFSPRYEGRSEPLLDEIRREFLAVCPPPAWPENEADDR